MKIYRKSRNSMFLSGMHTTTLVLMLALVIVGIDRTASALPIYTETVNVYTVLDGRLSGPPTAIWSHTYDGSADPIASATLTIVAEGVDAPGPGDGEKDAVYFEGNFLGYLQQQTFYNTGWDINPGPGALGYPLTELTTTVFNLNPSWIAGLTTASVQVESFWIMEVETSTLTVVSVPEPGTILLVGLGGLAHLRRRRA